MSDRPAHESQPHVATTGHEWDGIHELNTPLPRWWLWLFYATIVWAIGYWIVYPAWPLVSSYSNGIFNWHARGAVASDLAVLQAQRGPMMAKLEAAPLAEIASAIRAAASPPSPNVMYFGWAYDVVMDLSVGGKTCFGDKAFLSRPDVDLDQGRPFFVRIEGCGARLSARAISGRR